MKKILATVAVIGAVILAPSVSKKRLVIYAQSVPYTATVKWNPNPVGDNVSSYTVTLDTGTPQVIQASTCTPTLCSTTVSIPTFGAHSWSVFATNQTLSGGTGVTGTPQNGNASSQAFSLNQKPVAPAGQVIQ